MSGEVREASDGVEAVDRVCVKIPVREPYTVEDEAELFVPIFHEWIRENTLDPDLIVLDVADYAHVPDGPGIMLICHEVSFALDRSDSTFGLLAQRRVSFDGSAAGAVAATIRQVLGLATRLERHDRVDGRMTFDTSTLRVESNDRLRLPNTNAAYEAFVPIVEAALAQVFGASSPRLERVRNDPRDRLAVEVTVAADAAAGERADALTVTADKSSLEG